MPGPMIAMGAAMVAGSVLSSNAQKNAAEDAANAQGAASASQISEQRRQFEETRKILAPYVGAGEQSMGAQKDLIGLGGAEAQQKAISQLQSSPIFQSLLKQGETSLLQNASATGGLRGGNIQAALAQFSPNMLNQQINDQYSRLMGITQLGQASAAGQAAQGQMASSNIQNSLGNMGQAQAGSALAMGQANSNMYSQMANTAGTMFGSGAFGGYGGGAAAGGGGGFSGGGLAAPSSFGNLGGGF